MESSRTRYDTIAIALHWIIGIGIVFVWLAESFRGELFAKGSYAREALKAFHEPAGTVILAPNLKMNRKVHIDRGVTCVTCQKQRLVSGELGNRGTAEQLLGKLVRQR